MKLIDQQYLERPFFGSRRMAVWLRKEGYWVNRKRVRRLMRVMGLRALYRYPRTSKSGLGRKVYPYLLRGMRIPRPNQVWTADITYIPMARGFLYLVVIMDWYSRYVLSWRLSNTMDTEFCLDALEEALSEGTPDIFNTDQGAQFTSEAFTGLLERQGVTVSMDGKGSYTDNLFIERRVDKAFPTIVSKAHFRRVNSLMRSRAPKFSHSRRVGSSFLLSGLAKCKTCKTPLTGQFAKSGQYTYFCQTIIKRGKDDCNTPRLNARRFEQLIVSRMTWKAALGLLPSSIISRNWGLSATRPLSASSTYSLATV